MSAQGGSQSDSDSVQEVFEATVKTPVTCLNIAPC